MNEWSADVNKLREAGQRLEKDTDEFRALQTERTELENQINVRCLPSPSPFASTTRTESLDCRVQLHRRRILNAREEFTRISEKMDRKRETAKQRKKNLEEQHLNAVERKQKNDMEAAEKNREASEVEGQVSTLSTLRSGSRQVLPCVRLIPREGSGAERTLPDVQIRAMHQSLQAELEKGEKAYKKIKDQVSESKVSSLCSSRSFRFPASSR